VIRISKGKLGGGDIIPLPQLFETDKNPLPSWACRYHPSGACKSGDQCRFVHEIDASMVEHRSLGEWATDVRKLVAGELTNKDILAKGGYLECSG